jgi:acyl-CoA reductase-like NAD-dependent aldehyde dehydrogenase
MSARTMANERPVSLVQAGSKAGEIDVNSGMPASNAAPKAAIDLGLTGAVWTQDISRALRVSQAVDAGYIWVNGVGTHFKGVPYGGFKNSGIGREEGLGELLSYTEEKVINLCTGQIRGE